MATLTLKLEESKSETKAILMIECSNDISEDIIKATEEQYQKELSASGSIIPGEEKTKIQMILQDPVKINRIKGWLGEQCLKMINA